MNLAVQGCKTKMLECLRDILVKNIKQKLENKKHLENQDMEN